MYLPRDIIAHLYESLYRSRHPQSPSVLILTGLDPDALCACRILTSLFKHDFITHSIVPISGYADLTRVGQERIQPLRTSQGGTGGLIVCLGVGGLVDLEQLLGLEADDDGNGGMSGLEFWVFDSRRPWNLDNVFGVQGRTIDPATNEPAPFAGVTRGKLSTQFRQGQGGIIVFDDGDIEDELKAEREAYCALADMPELDDDLPDSDDSDSESEHDYDPHALPNSAQIPSSQRNDDSDHDSTGQKRKRRPSTSRSDDVTSDPDEGTPNKRRRSNSSSPIASPSRPGARGLAITSRARHLSPNADLDLATTQAPSAKQLRRRLIKLKRKHSAVLESYYQLGASYSEPISSLLWNLASELGRENNDLLWYAIVGVSSLQVSGKTSTGVGLSPLSTSGSISAWTKDRGEKIRGIFRDEVRRLNPTDLRDLTRDAGDEGIIPTRANGPTDMSIRISPEPRFLLVRHWSLYDSMVHSPYLSAKLHIWSERGRGMLHKLLAKMGISLSQCKQLYTHMDMEIKRGLREKLVRFAPQYGLEGLLPPETRRNTKEGWGFVRCWGYEICLSALDCAVIVGAMLDVGDIDRKAHGAELARIQQQQPAHSGASTPAGQQPEALLGAAVVENIETSREEALLARFWEAYESLSNVQKLKDNIIKAQELHRAILRTGTSLIAKKQIKFLTAFQVAVVKEGPDVGLFAHPGALTKLALWLAEATSEIDSIRGEKTKELVVAGLDEVRGVFVVIGLGGGSAVTAQREKEAQAGERKKERERKRAERKSKAEEKRRLRRERLEALGEDFDMEDETESEGSDLDESSSEDEDEATASRGNGLNRFGNAFQEVIEETGVRVKVDSFEHCIVEVQKEDLGTFLESLNTKAVMGK